MELDLTALRIDGIYPQRQEGYFMQRVKIPGAAFSAGQAEAIAGIAERYARERVHLTTRASIEFHWLTADCLAAVADILSSAGLTSRGACGGAVRGVVCGVPHQCDDGDIRHIAESLQRHFTGNPRFEGLPKKFKTGVFADTASGRHLIQDAALVRAGETGGGTCWDLWGAGGLGRAPQPGFLLAERIPGLRVVPHLEGMIQVYRDRTPPGKRLKHLVAEIGHDEFRSLVASAAALRPDFPLDDDRAGGPKGKDTAILEAGVFAGELSAGALRAMAQIARKFAGGFLMLSPEQNLLLAVPAESAAEGRTALAAAGFAGESREERVVFRVCPGSHECRMGLAATRDLAQSALAVMGDTGRGRRWAVSGCHNSCSQPQLADLGIIASRLSRGEVDQRQPLFDLYRRSGEAPFGAPARTGLTREELLRAIADIG